MIFDPQTAALADVLRWRRDVRHFREDPIPETTLLALQKAMDMAPSVGNSRPWRVIRVEDPQIRIQMRMIFDNQNALAACAYKGTAQAEYRRLKLSGLDRAPVQLAVFTDTDPAQGRGLGRQTMPETLVQSTIMAIFALWLSARAHNLGLGMVSILDPDAVLRLFDPPPNWRFTAYLCLGWPESHDDVPLLDRVGWQKNQPTPWQRR
ncbi:MAG: 5,6-dimethylbenzimidazole synthase [Paracoccus sp. (in: a-proteobacteria)]|nr:5,6-dimethylbenzimidazole synthase [Paracoccus sp. (in: a-proteobacteria)]